MYLVGDRKLKLVWSDSDGPLGDIGDLINRTARAAVVHGYSPAPLDVLEGKRREGEPLDLDVAVKEGATYYVVAGAVAGACVCVAGAWACASRSQAARRAGWALGPRPTRARAASRVRGVSQGQVGSVRVPNRALSLTAPPSPPNPAGAGGFVPRAEFDRVVAVVAELTKEQRLARALRLLPPVVPASLSSSSRSGEQSSSSTRSQQSSLKAKAVMFYFGVMAPPPEGKAYSMLGEIDVGEHSHCALAHIYPEGAPHAHELAQQLRLKPDFLTDPRCCLLLPKVVEVAMDREAVVIAPQRGGIITVLPLRMELLSLEEQAHVAPYLNKTLAWPTQTAAPACLPFMRLLAWRCVAALGTGRPPPAAPWAATDDAVTAVLEAAMSASQSEEGTGGLAELAGAFE